MARTLPVCPTQLKRADLCVPTCTNSLLLRPGCCSCLLASAGWPWLVFSACQVAQSRVAALVCLVQCGGSSSLVTECGWLAQLVTSQPRKCLMHLCCALLRLFEGYCAAQICEVMSLVLCLGGFRQLAAGLPAVENLLGGFADALSGLTLHQGATSLALMLGM